MKKKLSLNGTKWNAICPVIYLFFLFILKCCLVCVKTAIKEGEDSKRMISKSKEKQGTQPLKSRIISLGRGSSQIQPHEAHT